MHRYVAIYARLVASGYSRDASLVAIRRAYALTPRQVHALARETALGEIRTRLARVG